MTASELLVLLGRAWSRLLLYPGGLAAFAAAWLVFNLTSKREPRTENREPANCAGSRFLVLGSIVPPWLALALLPLPLAVALPRQVDIVVAIALLEWPRILAIRQDLRAGDPRRLAAALNGYPPLILATLALAQSSGSLEVAALARAPGDLGSAGVLHWLGAVAFVLALPPALGIGAFGENREPRIENREPRIEDRGSRTEDRGPRTEDRGPRTRSREPRTEDRGPGAENREPRTEDRHPITRFGWRRLVSIRISIADFFAGGALAVGLRLRALGLIALAALPWSGSQDDSGWALLRTLVAASLIAGLLWGFDRLTCGQLARRWARAYLALDAALLLALLWAAYQALQSRLA